jgi:hypothetical protein
MLDRLIPLALLRKSPTQALMGFGMFRLVPHGLPEIINRLFQLTSYR